MYELPPGQALCPYHYEYGEEEWLLVLEGRPSVRTPEGTEELAPCDVVFFPQGPEGAHQIRNDCDDAARVLMLSDRASPAATAYPDSDKVGVWTGIKEEDLESARRSSAVEYYDQERAWDSQSSTSRSSGRTGTSSRATTPSCSAGRSTPTTR